MALLFSLITLPYSANALEPVISQETIEYHHGKHLQTYVDNLNKLVAGTEFEAMPLEEIVAKSQGAIFNNAGQILNHNLYFTQFKPYDKEQSPITNDQLPIIKAIVRDFGSFEAFKAEFEQKGSDEWLSVGVYDLDDKNDCTLIRLAERITTRRLHEHGITFKISKTDSYGEC